jgi:hypothetical protein
MSTNPKSFGPPPPPPPEEDGGMLPAVEPNPLEPITPLPEPVVELELLALLPGEPVDMRSEKRLVEPRTAPKLLAGELVEVAPEAPDEEDVLVAVFVDAIVVVEALTLEAFELELRDDTRLPL